MIAGAMIQMGVAIWALVVAARLRVRAPEAAGLLASAAIIELVWRTIDCARMAGSAALYDAGLEIVIDVIAVLDLLERAAILALAARAARAAAKP